ITVISELKVAETEPSVFLSQDTQGNIKTVISDYCTDVFSSLEEEQMATKVPEEPKEERGNNTYEEEQVPDCVPGLIDQGEANLLGNYGSFFHSKNSDFVEKAQACDKLTCLETVQPSSHSSL